MMSGEHGLFFGGGFMWLIWIVIIVGLFYLIRGALSINASNNSNNDKESPIDILNKRLAKGEIDEEEYKRIRDDIEK